MADSADLEQVGSTWRRWDPHIHAPGTLKNDQFKSWDAFLARVESANPPLAAVGITA